MRSSILSVVLLVASCNGVDGGTQSPPDGRILVSGNDMGALTESINLSRSGFPLTGAVVLVNGTPMLEAQPGHYLGQLPGAIPPGATIEIEVRSGPDTVRGTTTVPAVPTLVTPAGGSTIRLGTPLDFTWIDSSDPDEFRIGILYNGTGELASYGPTARSGTVVTSRIPASTTTLAAFLYAYGDGTFTGPVNPDSRMRVRQPGATVNIVPVP